MRSAGIFAALLLLGGLAMAQESAMEPAGNRARDVFTVARLDDSLASFVGSIEATGMTNVLRGDQPLTIFALSNQAFATLSKEDREALMTNRVAMHFLLGHYIVPGDISPDDGENFLAARTLVGAKLRAEIRSEGTYVNGAKLTQPAIRCANGTIYVLDSFDLGLVHDAAAASKAGRK
jgi:transforming growth factor-beta-induced protein